MAETPGNGQEGQRSGLGLERLAMRQVAPASTTVPGEGIPARVWLRLLGVVCVVALAGLVAWWVRVGSGILPGSQEAKKLTQKVEERKGWQYGILRGVRLKRADTAIIEVASESYLDKICERPEVAAWAARIAVEVPFSPGPGELKQLQTKRALRLAVLEALEAFREAEPGRDLRLEIRQQGKDIGEAEYLRRDGLPVLQKGRVHLEEGGEMGPSAGGRPGGE